jgi:hypothetical protein
MASDTAGTGRCEGSGGAGAGRDGLDAAAGQPGHDLPDLVAGDREPDPLLPADRPSTLASAVVIPTT